ncbi:MAG: hypothetical protein CMH57_04435 [Myxococcales bacterium]|nr:hypothetical protein [Myxococcales bacterium]
MLIFTRFVETAEALYRRLVAAFPGRGVGLVCGPGARHTGQGPGKGVPRRMVLERFMGGGDARARLRILVATDVLSEGLDLQVGGAVVSYDLPWNPRRLVQRFGRLDRLGPTRRTIETVLVRPERELEELLGAMRTLQRRLGEAAELVGGLDPWLGEPVEAPPAELWALPRDRRFDVEFMMRSDLLSFGASQGVGAPPLGWGMRAGPRSPAGTVLVFDLMLPGAPLHWVFVPDEGAVQRDRAVLYPRVRGVLRRPTWPLERPPPRAQRLGLMDALGHQERLWSACLQPIVPPPASAAARLLRRLSAVSPPASEEPEALQAHERLMGLLASPLPMGAVTQIEEGLEREEEVDPARWLERLSAYVEEGSRPKEPGAVRLVGFVTFEEVSGRSDG